MINIEKRLNELAEQEVNIKLTIDAINMTNIAWASTEKMIELNKRLLCEQVKLNRVQGEISGLMRLQREEAERKAVIDEN